MPNLLREKLHFEKFLEALNVVPLGDYEVGESPDFRVNLAGRIIGIEHTQIFLEGSKDIKLVAIESIGNDIARRVQLKGKELDVNFQATLLLNLLAAMKENQREQLASEIFNEIKSALKNNPPAVLESYELRPEDDRITSITFVATRQNLTTRVMVARAGWVKQSIDEEIVGAITKKILKQSIMSQDVMRSGF